MIQIAGRQYSLMVLFAVALHYVWTAGLLIDQNAVHATGLYIFQRLLGIEPVLLPAIFCFVATLALASMMMPASTYSVLLMLPQQTTLMISAYSALHATYLGQYSDGVDRPRAHIMVDQAPAILAALFHTLAIVRVGREWTST